MTRSTLIIAILAGAASLLLFIAGMSSRSLTLPLITLTALPVTIASLGWGTRAGFGAAAIATISTVIITNLPIGLLYGFGFGLPIAYLGHCIGLSRVNEDDNSVEWFPLGAVFFRTALYGGAFVGLALIIAAFDPQIIALEFKSAFAKLQEDLSPEAITSLDGFIDFYVKLIPYVAPMFWLLTIGFNLLLGAAIVRQSEKLLRPAVRLKDVDLPFIGVGILSAGLILTLATPPIAYIGSALTGSFAMAFIVLGFNTVHVLMARSSAKIPVLVILYFTTLLFSFPLALMLVLGLADHGLKIRQRHLAANPNHPS